MKKRSIRGVQNIDDDKVVALIMAIPQERFRAYASFVYLFGNRVSEGLGLPKREPVPEEFYEYTRHSKKGSRTIRMQKYTLVPNEWEIEPINASQIDLDEEKGLLWCNGIRTFKIEGRPIRNAWALINGINERVLATILWNYVVKIRLDEGESAFLFTFTRQQCYNAFVKYIGINGFPHKLRDLRATKDSTVYGLDAKDLQHKYNWASAEMAMYYGRKNTTDIIAKMKKNSN